MSGSVPTFRPRPVRLSRASARALLLLLLLVGAFFRLDGLRWDEGHHLHPDERFISMVEERLTVPTSLSEYFDSARSSWNPYNRGFDSFVYGTLPLILARGVGTLVGKTGYDGTYLVGRVLSALFDLLTVWVVYRLGRRFAGRRASLGAAALLAFSPLGIQLSHFWGVDTFLTTFSALALLGAVRHAQGRSGLAGDAAAGMTVGLAAACKVPGLALLAPFGLAFLVRALSPAAAGERPLRARRIGRALAGAVIVGGTAAIVLRIALPHAFRGPGFFNFELDPRYLSDLGRLAAINRSFAGFPPSLQWAGRTAFFPIRNFFLWGAGPFFATAALAGAIAALRTGLRRGRADRLVLLIHPLLVFGYHALSNAKTIRYFYPAYPALAVLAALFLAAVAARARASSGLAARLARAVPGVVLIGSFLGALAFTAIYRRPHPRVAASRWIYQNVTPPARFANEEWDDGQPMPMEGFDAGAYAGPVLRIFIPDSAEKAQELTDALVKADWIAITSNRVYASVTRIPAVFPMSVAYYRALFEGRLGFERAAEFTSYPATGPFEIPDDAAEETFTVYDHPRVLLFRKTPAFSAARVRRMLLAPLEGRAPPTMHEWERWPKARRVVAPPVLPGRGARIDLPATAPDREVSSIPALLLWLIAILLTGAAALPLGWLLFSRLEDRGIGFAKVVGLVISTFLLSLAVTLRLLPNGRLAAWLALLAVALLSAAILAAKRRAIAEILIRQRGELLAGEAVFLAGFLLFLGFRALNPEISWGEKPMDFSILNILVRTATLPVSDPWFAGVPLGYYTFGHQMMAFLTLLTGLSTRYTFNLAFGLLGGAILQGSYSLARQWGGTRRAGLAGAAFVGLLGNLGGLRDWWMTRRPSGQPLDWNYFWATSRVVKDTINEYPFWSLLFADLHAHLLAVPIFLAFLAAALQFARAHSIPGARPRERLAAALLLGFLAACQALTNAWDVPLLSGLLLLIAGAAALAPGVSRWRAVLRALLGLSIAAATGLAATLPLWTRAGGGPGWGWNVEKGASVFDVATVFGLFFFAAFAWWLTAASSWWAPRGVRRALLFAAGAVLLAAAALHSAELLCSAGILLFGSAALFLAKNSEDRLVLGLRRDGVLPDPPHAARLPLRPDEHLLQALLRGWILFAVALCRPRLRRPVRRRVRALAPPRPGALPAPLRGLPVHDGHGGPRRGRVLAADLHGAAMPPRSTASAISSARAPGSTSAVLWLRSTLRGTPVVLEAQGPSYQDFGRISMLTGLPTVLGWDYHVKQRGNPNRRSRPAGPPSNDLLEPGSRSGRGPSSAGTASATSYVGRVERQIYPSRGPGQVRAARDLFLRSTRTRR